MTAEPARKALTDALVGSGGQRGSVGGVAGLDNFVVRGGALADADVTRFDLVAAMADGVVSDIVKAVSGLIQKQFLDYDPSYQTSTSQVLVEDLAEIPELAAVDAVVRLGNVDDDGGGEQVVAMAHAVGTGSNKIVAYRLKGPGIATRRSRGDHAHPARRHLPAHRGRRALLRAAVRRVHLRRLRVLHHGDLDPDQAPRG